jgi:hypothetical protein
MQMLFIKKNIKLLLCLIVLQLNIFLSYCFANTGVEVMDKVYQEANKNKNKVADVKLTILDSENNERVRFFTLKTKITDDFDKSIIKFYEPVNIKGTSLLTHKNKKNDESLQWIYFPSFKSVKSISNQEKDQSFMGSDFSYSDIAGRLLKDDNHVLVKEDKDYYYVRSIPKNESSYSKIDSIVNKSNNVAVKISFYNKQNEIFKVLTNEKIANINGAYEVVFSRMKNLTTKGSSIIEKNNIDTLKNIKDDELTIKALTLD